MLNVTFLTDTGLRREHNEDAVLIDKTSATFLVADGMGGHEKGEIASRILVETFAEMNEQVAYSYEDEATIVPSNMIEKKLNECISVASRRMGEYTLSHGIKGTIGTTVVGLKYLVTTQAWSVFHLGDSRAYRFNENSLLRLTTDHSRIEELRREHGEEEVQHVSSSTVTKVVGNFEPFALEIQYVKAAKGDILFLCSDGISDLCTDDELLLLFLRYKMDLTLLAEQIKSLVYSRGARDNLSLILIEILDQ